MKLAHGNGINGEHIAGDKTILYFVRTDMRTANDLAERDMPAGVGQWNWGAFLLNWIWGLGNRTYIALLCLIPGVNLVMIFVLGAKGSQWAWKNKKWSDVVQFSRTQGVWSAFALGTLAGIVVAGIFFAVVLIIIFNNVFM
jgi:hypothetical protein